MPATQHLVCDDSRLARHDFARVLCVSRDNSIQRLSLETPPYNVSLETPPYNNSFPLTTWDTKACHQLGNHTRESHRHTDRKRNTFNGKQAVVGFSSRARQAVQASLNNEVRNWISSLCMHLQVGWDVVSGPGACSVFASHEENVGLLLARKRTVKKMEIQNEFPKLVLGMTVHFTNRMLSKFRLHNKQLNLCMPGSSRPKINSVKSSRWWSLVGNRGRHEEG